MGIGNIYNYNGFWGNPLYNRRWGISIESGYIKSGWYEGTSSGSTNLVQLQANVWYEAEIVLNGGEYIVRVWKLDTPGTIYERAETHSTWAGAAWKFHNQWHTAVGTFDNYQEFNPANSLGRRTLMKTTTSTWTTETAAAWSYDQRGRVVSESRMIAGSGTFLTQWGYNSGDMLSWIKYPGDNAGASGEQVNYTYLPQGALLKVSNPTYTYAKEMKYDAAGRLTQIVNQISTEDEVTRTYAYYGWDETVQISQEEEVGQGGRLRQIDSESNISLQNLVYTYDAVGNVKSIVDAVASETSIYDYDALNRLTSVAGPNYDESYTYDSATGNLSSKTEMGDYTYSTAHKHAVTSTNTGWSYEYDANGNMTRRDPPGTDYYEFVYDAENRIQQAKKNGVITATFTYDGDGARVKAALGAVTTAYIGNYYEWSGSAGTMVKYYFAGSQRIAMRTGTAAPKWILGDHLGSTSVVTDYYGANPVYQRYKPFGETRLTNPLGTKYTFTGQLSHTDDFGLLFFNARWVDPQLARFASPDTIVPDAYNPQDYDRYAYGRSNPLRYIDPSGHWVCSISSQGEKAGITVEMCETWVNTAFAVLQLTGTGQKIVDAFLNADENSEITISVGGELPNVNGNILGDTMYLSEEIFLTDPLDPNTWGPLDSRHPSGLSTFAHESIHAGQGFLSAFSAYGEVEAYYHEYQLNKEQNALINQYNNAKDEGDEMISTIDPHHLAVFVGRNYGENWNDPHNVRDFRQQHLPWFYSVNGLLFHKYEGGIISD